MLIESLARLTLVNEEMKAQGIVLGSKEFMKETDQILHSQIQSLQKDMQFQNENPGPYAFGIGTKTINIFPPTFTESADWVLIVYDEATETKERLFVFQSIYGLVENLQHAFKHIQQGHASTTEQDRESKAETGSVQDHP